MQQSFWNGLSGLKVQQFGVDSWSNNIANINTTAYKTRVPRFTTLYSQSLNHPTAGSGDKQYGATVAENAIDFKSAPTTNTGRLFDLALEKKGFFITKSPNGLSYTRNGSFHKDADGYLVTSAGKRVQGIDFKKVNGDTINRKAINAKDFIVNDVTKLSDIHIPQLASLKANQTKNVTVSPYLNKKSNIVPMETSFQYVQNYYANTNSSIDLEKVDKFFNIKKGDVFSMKTSQGSHNFVYGTDFTTISDLKEKIKEADSRISLYYTKGRFSLENISPNSVEVDFSSTSRKFLDSFGLPRHTNIVFGKSFFLNKVSTRQILQTDFNALSSSQGSTRIRDGDSISIHIKDKTYTMYYGKANETKVNGTVLGQKDTFLTLGEFLSKMNAKTGLNAMFRDNRIYFKDMDDPALSISSNNHQLLTSLGVPSDLGTINKGSSIAGANLNISTFSYSIPILDKNGNKYYIKTRYVLKTNQDESMQQDEVWRTNSVLLDGDGNRVNNKEYIALLKIDPKNGKPAMYSLDENKKQTKINSIKIDFLKNEPINYEVGGNLNNISLASLSGNSRLLAKNIDGNKPGDLQSISINEEGLIAANFENNETEVLGMISVVDFENTQGLKPIGNNEYVVQYTLKDNKKRAMSGKIKMLWDGEKTSAQIASGRLEQSNVELSVGLTALIALQRAYSASSKTVSASDEMIKEAINLKR